MSCYFCCSNNAGKKKLSHAAQSSELIPHKYICIMFYVNKTLKLKNVFKQNGRKITFSKLNYCRSKQAFFKADLNWHVHKNVIKLECIPLWQVKTMSRKLMTRVYTVSKFTFSDIFPRYRNVWKKKPREKEV